MNDQPNIRERPRRPYGGGIYGESVYGHFAILWEQEKPCTPPWNATAPCAPSWQRQDVCTPVWR